jgi:hypothetical protein
MSILWHILGWNWKVRRLRKKWDRLRERALKKKNPIRMEALKKLDVINPNLTTLEEQRLGRIDKARISKDVEISLEEVKALIKAKPEEIMRARQKTFQRQQSSAPS